MTIPFRKFASALTFVTLATAFGTAVADFDPKACYERCMEKEKDREKCQYICNYKK
jgi:hypothetical protein